MKDYIREVTFVKSSPDHSGCPLEIHPEYAFVGRSNVGKSSLINYLSGNRKLAKTSKLPGRTRLINHFIVDHSWYLVDLPGYGYARISKSERNKLITLIYNYLQHRTMLTCLFLLIDIRHSPQETDMDFIRWLGINKIPFALCFTKIDKLSTSQRNKKSNLYLKALLKEWESLPPVFYTSTIRKQGREEILSFIEETNKSLNTKKWYYY